MTHNDFNEYMEKWNQICEQQSEKKTKKNPTSFFTDTKSVNKPGPSKLLVEGWHKIIDGAEDYDSDYISDTRADKLMADEGGGWRENEDDYDSPPPTGRAGEIKPPEEMFMESNNENFYWETLAENLKKKEPKSPNGAKFVNTYEAAQITGLSMGHFLKCVWNLKEFVQPELTKRGWLYDSTKVKEIGSILSEAKQPPQGFGQLVRGSKQLTKGDITYLNEPTTMNSVGRDSNPDDDSSSAVEMPIRVSKFSSSDDFDNLAEMKRRLEILERRVHKADVEMNVKKRDKLTKELKKLRAAISRLSNDAQSKFDKDVT